MASPLVIGWRVR